MGAAFKDFLESEHNLEPWHFLEAVRELEHVTVPKEQAKKTKEIIDKFVKPGSEEEINISAGSRNFITDIYKKQENSEEWILDITPSKLFSDCFKLVVFILSHDSFKRFVRTPECETIMKQCKHDSKVISPLITTKFDFDDEYFTHPHFRDRDIDFFLSLFQDSYNWKLFGSKAEENMNAYIGTSNFLPDVKLLKTVRISKFECILPCTFEQALISYFDNEQIYKSDPNCGKYETDEYYTYDQLVEFHKKNRTEMDIVKYKRDLSVNSMCLKLPFPFNSRTANYALSGHYDEKNQIFMRIGKSFLPQTEKFGTKNVEAVPPKRGAKPKKTKVYSIFIFAAGIYKKLDDNRVFFQEVNIMDLAGWFAKESLFKVVTKDRKDKFRNQMLELARAYPQDAKISDYKDYLSKLVDGKTNGLGKILVNTVEMNKEEKEEKKDEIKEETNEDRNEAKEEKIEVTSVKETIKEESKEGKKEEVKEEIKEDIETKGDSKGETKEETKEDAKDEEKEDKIEQQETKEQTNSAPVSEIDGETTNLSVPNKLHQYCIGKGGSIIKEITSESGCKLNLEGDNIEIKGDNRKLAVELIMKKLQEVGWFFENNEWIERTKQDELWKKYRGEAQKEVELRNVCYEKSKKAFEEGDKELAKQLSEEGKEHDEKWKILTKEAGKNIFKEMNENNDKNTIDLHGLFVEEAVEFVKERLNELKGNDVTLSIITGAGNHSSAGALIKPKIHELLKEESLTFTEEKNGQVDVKIN
eukprot:gene6435-10443_t